MLLKCYSIMQRRYKKPDVAMAALVQWVACRLSVPSYRDYATPTLTLDMYDDLYAAFDLDLLRQDRWDWLGELALYLGLEGWVPYDIGRGEAVEYARSRLPGNLGTSDVIFDPLAGTGRLFFALLDLGVNCIMAGTEPVHRPYRILVLNKHIYDMPVYVLRARHKLPFSSPAWLRCNVYLPVRRFPRS